MKVETVTPYSSNESKRTQIMRAFDGIARQYDRLNRILSLGLDIGWRRRALLHLPAGTPIRVLDVATGTADFAIMAARRLPLARVMGIDLSEGMLAAGRRKVLASGLSERIALQTGDGLALDFPSATFDAVSAAFGVRNFEDLAAGFAEIRRVLKAGGRVVILELSEPRSFPMRQLHRFYLRRWIPLVGHVLTGLASEYRYLPASIEQVPQGEVMLALLRNAGFTQCRFETYTFGICTCYTGLAPT
jgi:demethylmenaquinone methyltransferase/2-methoxy-6-polyprenyl-1,4-benzoquinol methylase